MDSLLLLAVNVVMFSGWAVRIGGGASTGDFGRAVVRKGRMRVMMKRGNEVILGESDILEDSR